MKHMKKVIGLSLLAASMASQADTLTLNANILPNVCIFDAADLAQTVAVPKTTVVQLKSGTYISTDFEIKVSNCDPSITSMTANASGSAVDSNVPGYGTAAVLANNGTATGVGIGLLGLNSVSGSSAGELPLGTESAAATLVLDGATQTTYGAIKLGAKVVPLDTAVDATEGTVNSISTITLTTS